MKPARYMRRHASVDALVFDGTRGSALAIVEWLGVAVVRAYDEVEHTLTLAAGDMLSVVPAGQYVVQLISLGYVFPIRPDAFERLYETVS